MSDAKGGEIEFDRCSLLAGRPRSHWLDTELLFWATLAWSCRCLSVRSPYTLPPFSPPYNIRALKNTLVDTHEPPVSFPGPGETHTFVRKPCFFAPVFFFLLRSTARGGSLLPLPVSYLPVMKRRGRTLMWTQVTIQIQTNQKRKLENGGERRSKLHGAKLGSPSVGGGGRSASSARRGKCEQTGEIPRSRAAKRTVETEKKRQTQS